MKNILIVLALIAFVISGCSLTNKIGRKKKDCKEFNSYLLEVVNDTVIVEVPTLKIVDDNIYPMLDSVISSTEKCEYFDKRIPYLHAFRFSEKEMGIDSVHTIYNRLSFEKALGLYFDRMEGNNISINHGIFYYKKYSFVMHLEDVGEKYPFCIRTGCNYRIVAPTLNSEGITISSIDFAIKSEKYIIVEDNACEPPLIRSH